MSKLGSHRIIRSRAWVAVSLAVAGTSSAALAQTNGTWVNPTGGAWETTTNWQDGILPSDGGIAIFNEAGAGRTITLNDGTLPTLSEIRFNSTGVHVLNVAALALAGINFPATGGVINAVKSPLSTPSTFDVGHQINVSLGGGKLTKIGAGTTTLSQVNSYIDGTFIDGGVLRISGGDGSLGDTSGAVTISNNAFLRVSLTALTSSRTFNIGVGGGTIDLFAAATINGTINGSTTLTKVRGGALTLRGNNTGFTGNIVFNTGTLGLSGSQGALPNASALDINGSLSLDPTSGNNNDRIGDTVPIRMRGGQLQIGTGTASATTSETVGNVTLASGSQLITALAGATGQQSLTMNSLIRENRSTLLVRGTGLGRPAGASVAFVGVTNAPTLVGGGGADGTTTISVLPWAVSQIDNITNTFIGTSLATIGSRGIRPLSATEYATDLSGPATNNVRVGATLPTTTLTVPGGGATVNAINITSALNGTVVTPGTVTGTGALTVTSGAVLVSSGGSASISAPIVFPAGTEGVLHLYGTAGTSNTLSGDTGVTKAGGGSWTIVGEGNSSTYSGQTVLNGGITRYGANVPNNAPSPFGSSSDAIVLQGSTVFNVQLWATGNVVVDRPLIVRGDGNGVTGLGNSAGSESVTWNGNISLERDLRLEFDPSPAAVINGNISGVGGLTDAFGAGTVLNGNNTFSGGMNLVTGTYIAGSDTAFGTGPIYGTGSGTAVGVLSTSGGPRTLNNKLIIFTGLGFSNSDPMTFTGEVDSAGRPGPLVVAGTAPVILAGKVTNGGLSKQGPGTLILASNNNDYIGANSVLAGTLQVGNGGTTGVLGAGAVSISTGATLAFNRSDSVVVPNNITGTTVATTGTVSLPATSGVVTLSGSLSNINVSVAGGELRTVQPLISTNGAISVTGGKAVINTGAAGVDGIAARVTAASAVTGGVIEIAGSGKTLVAGALTIGSGGFVDLKANDMIVQGGNLAGIRSLVSEWWTGNSGLPGSTGLGSSEAFYTVDGGFATLAVYDNSGTGGSATFTNFNGIAVTAADVLVKYTYRGDTDLNGVVDATDIANVLKGMQGLGSGWNFGDVNYDGVVNTFDLGLAQSALLGQGAPLGRAAGFGGGIELGGGVIPEPASLGLLIAAVPLMSRRRR